MNVKLSIFRLARNYGHEWAVDDMLSEFNEHGIADLDSLTTAFHRWQEENSEMPGIGPATEHVTESGRTSWAAFGRRVAITINRPSSLVGLVGGSIPVLEAIVQCSVDGSAEWCSSLEACTLAEDRHYVAMLQALESLEVGDLDECPAWEACVGRLAGMYGPWEVRYWGLVKKGLVRPSVIDTLEWVDGGWKLTPTDWEHVERRVSQYAKC